MSWVNGELETAEKELEERATPLRLRDARAASDDGYEDYLTMAEELTRSVRVAVSKEKIKILRDCKGILEEIDGHDNGRGFIRGDDEGETVP